MSTLKLNKDWGKHKAGAIVTVPFLESKALVAEGIASRMQGNVPTVTPGEISKDFRGLAAELQAAKNEIAELRQRNKELEKDVKNLLEENAEQEKQINELLAMTGSDEKKPSDEEKKPKADGK